MSRIAPPQRFINVTDDRDRMLALGAALVSVALWASAFVGIRSADRSLAPGALALGRLTVGAIALGVLMVVRREPLPSRRALPGIVVCGVLWFAVYTVLLNEAERRIDAGTAAMLVNTGPIFIAILAGFVLREGFPRRLFLGCLVSFAGVVLIGVVTSRHGVGGGWGAVLCVLAALAYAAGLVAQKPTLRHASPLAVTWMACTVGAIACLPFAPRLASDLGHARGSAIAWTVYLGIFPTAIGFATWAFALARTEAGRLGSTTYLVPPLAILLSWAMLAEVPPLLTIPGGVLCLAGVAVARSRGRAPSARPQDEVAAQRDRHPRPGREYERERTAQRA
jgi:drug/metabolite transporter (DMT)-like permease